MKRFATLALAAIFALSFSANVAAAPEFSGEFTISNEIDLNANVIDVAGDGADLTFSLSAGEEGIWSLSVDLGSAKTGRPSFAVPLETTTGDVVYIYQTWGDYAKDLDGNYYSGLSDYNGVSNFLTKVSSKAAVDRQRAVAGDDWTAIDVAKVGAVTGLELGAYELSITPGPFSLIVAGNGSAPKTTDLFEFIASDDEPDDPKFQLTTDIAGIGLTAEYETGGDAVYVFAKTPVAGVGTFGVAFKDSDLADDEAGMGFSADVSSDVLGFATLKGGIAFDMNAPDGTDSVAFAVGADVPVIEGVVVNASYKNDGRGKAENEHVQTISAGVKYNGDMVTASISRTTNKENDEAKLTLKAGVNYPVIADVFTVKANFERISDEDDAITTTASDYKWNGINVGDIVKGLMTVSASADYAVSEAFSVTPSIKYQSFTFGVAADTHGFVWGNEEVTGTITTLGISGTYKFSDAASVTLGFENASGDAVKTKADDTVLPEVDVTKLTTAFTVSF